uniref:Uncharacterized protein n=1 Tax=Amphimedon queenslandica TaxID=400682 RepID=A0A1X7UPG9_AMPQE
MKDCIDGVFYTLWTRWEMNGSPEITLKEFIQAVKHQLILRYTPTTGLTGLDEEDDDEDEKRATLVVPLESSGQDKVLYKYNFDVSMVVLGVKMIYVPLLPGHKKRLTQTVKSVLAKSVSAQSTYVDLTLSFDNDLPGSPFRYYY